MQHVYNPGIGIFEEKKSFKKHNVRVIYYLSNGSIVRSYVWNY